MLAASVSRARVSSSTSMRSLVVGAFFPLLLLGCGSGGTPKALRAPVASVDVAFARPALDLPIPAHRKVDLGFELAGQPFPSPLLYATIGGRSTWLVVDTGTSYHALSEWLATDLALPLSSTNTGRDHLGRDIRISVIDRATIATSEWGMLCRRAAPRHRRARAVSAAQPRRLPLAAVPRARRRRARPPRPRPRRDAGRLEGRRGHLQPREPRRPLPDRREPRLPRDGRRSRTEPSAVPATIEGEAVTLLIDTGAERTNLRVGSRAGQKLALRANGDLTQGLHGAGGTFSALTVPDARVQIGEIGRTTDVEMVLRRAERRLPRRRRARDGHPPWLVHPLARQRPARWPLRQRADPRRVARRASSLFGLRAVDGRRTRTRHHFIDWM